MRTAAAPDRAGKGVLVVMNDEINAARDVTKSNTYRVETFRSGELGFLGYVDQDKVASTARRTSATPCDSEFDLGGVEALPRVDILYCYVAADNAAADRAAARAGVRGIIFAGTGAGGLSDAEKAAVRTMRPAAAARPVFVRSSRVGNGRVIGRSEYDKLGMIPADNLNPQKARILLMLALTQTTTRSEIRRMFSEY